MMLYLTQVWDKRNAAGTIANEDLPHAIREGAMLRVRPKSLTVAVILARLFPVMWGTDTGPEVMQRIAAPMVGGMITVTLMSMFVIPAAYLLMRRRREPLAQPNQSVQLKQGQGLPPDGRRAAIVIRGDINRRASEQALFSVDRYLKSGRLAAKFAGRRCEI